MQPQRNNSEADATAHLHVDSSSSSLPTEEAASDESAGRRNRIRSLSNTFGDLFRSKKRTRRESVDEEEGGRAGIDHSERDS
jgi:hypothetical protein